MRARFCPPLFAKGLLVRQVKPVSVVVSVGFGDGARCCSALRAYPWATKAEIRGYSRCCVSVRFGAKRLARILSPQPLPFRHPGDGLINLTNIETYCNGAEAAIPV